MPKKRVRIKDIARAAGVSTGTVDRVIHNRGNVLPAVKKRVEEVMKTLNYQPNIMASTLANNKVLKIATLLPDYKQDAFWEAPIKGIERAIGANQHFSLSVTHYFFEENNLQTFVNESQRILANLPDALILAPIFQKESKAFLKVLTEKSLPVVLINTHLPAVESTCYIGQDSYQSGQLAARLISDRQPENATYLLLHLEAEERTANATHIYQKEAGFMDYFKESNKSNIIFKRAYSESEEGLSLTQFLKNILDEIPSPTGIFVSTSKAYQLIESAGERLKNTCIIGFDLLPKNVDFLKAGKIAYLINQNPTKQGFLAITNLIDLLLLKKSIKSIQYLPLDIVVKENVTYYL